MDKFPRSNHHHDLFDKDIATNSVSIFDFVEPNKMYTASLPVTVSEYGRNQIFHEVYMATGRIEQQPLLWDKNKTVDLRVDAVALDTSDKAPFGWMGVATKSDGLEYQGSFLKRLMNYLWKEHKVKLPTELIGKIGNIVGKDASTNSKYYFRFDPYYNYRRGEFGDDDSCYWNDRQGARVLIRNEGGCFVEFFDNESAYVSGGMVRNGNGVGRAWILPINQWLHTDVPVFIMCNVYTNMRLSKYSAARAIATVLNMNYKMADFVSNQDVFWINGNCGFVMSQDQEVLQNITQEIYVNYSHYYEDIDDPELECGSDNRYCCDNCGEYVDEDEWYGEHDLCSSCYHDRFCSCDGCGSEIDEEYDVHAHVGYQTYCSSCLSRNGYIQCEGCGEWSDDCTEVDGDKFVCPHCLENYYSQCERCGEWYENSRVYELGEYHEVVCKDCITDEDDTTGQFECKQCKQIVWEEDRPDTKLGELGYCVRCSRGLQICESCNTVMPYWKSSCDGCGKIVETDDYL